MPETTRTRPCPSCGAPAAVTWNHTMVWQLDYPAREDVSRFDCPSGCRVPHHDVGQIYPTADSAAQQPPTA